jgi:hypothetical protein
MGRMLGNERIKVPFGFVSPAFSVDVLESVQEIFLVLGNGDSSRCDERESILKSLIQLGVISGIVCFIESVDVAVELRLSGPLIQFWPARACFLILDVDAVEVRYCSVHVLERVGHYCERESLDFFVFFGPARPLGLASPEQLGPLRRP